MKRVLPFLLSVPLLLLTSCSGHRFLGHDPHVAFQAREDYVKTSEVFRNDALLKRAEAENTTVRVDLSDQRAQLLVDDRVALDAPCCTGKAGKTTPVGIFPIKEKIRDKRSSIFGSLYRNGRRIYKGDRRKYGGSYDSYVGSALPFWMRLCDSGIGLHGSKYVHRHPRSNGCVRMPDEAVSTIYSVVGEGTPVKVVR